MEIKSFTQIHSKGDIEILGNEIILKKIKPKDISIFTELLKDKQYRYFFCLEGKNEDYFKEYINRLIVQMESGYGTAFTIVKPGFIINKTIGYIVSNYVPIPAKLGKGIFLNMNFAILPKYRRKGFAMDAITTLMKPYALSPVRFAMLDISEDNLPSVELAEKLGFLQDINNPLFDNHHMEIGMHYKWFKSTRQYSF